MSEVEPRAEMLQMALDRVQAGESVDAVLSSLGDDTALADDLRLLLRMDKLLPVAAPAGFRAALQSELQQRIEPDVERALRRRFVTSLAGVLAALVLLAWSAVVVSADSLPGDALYAVKLAHERTQLLLAADASARARVYLELADNRLSELAELARLGIPIPASLVEDLIGAQGEALHEALESGDEGLIDAAEQSSIQAGMTVADIAEEAPSDSRDLLEWAGAALRPEAPEAAPGMLPSAAPPEAPTTSLTDPLEPSATPTATLPVTAEPLAPSPTVALGGAATATELQPTAEAGATSVPSAPSATATQKLQSTVTPLSTSAPPPKATLPPTIAAQWTQRALEATEEARPTATNTPGSGRRHLAPTTEPTPTDDTDEATPVVPTEAPIPAPTQTATAQSTSGAHDSRRY